MQIEHEDRVQDKKRVPAVQSIAGGPTAAFWTIVVIASVLVFVVGGMLIRQRAEPILRRFRKV